MITHKKFYQTYLQKNSYPRELKNIDLDTDPSAYIYRDGRKLINFSSNDYLGLARHPLLISRSNEFSKQWGVGASSSRLVCGNLSIYEKIENQLAEKLNKPAALILGAGYQANISVLEALFDTQVLGEKPLVFSDKNCHTSMIGMTKYISHLYRFKHNDLAHLKLLLEKYSTSTKPKFILVESIYSMDGDQADLKNIILLAREHNAFLYLDDAHSVGLYGNNGFGLAADISEDIDMIMGTFSKGLGSYGSYIACSESMRDYLINKCRGLIYSTGLSPANLGAISAAIEIIPQLQKERSDIIKKSEHVRNFFYENNMDMGTSTTHIIPWIIGDAKKTLLISQQLEQDGILGVTIRPPTVQIKKSRIRFCLNARHRDEDIKALLKSLLINWTF